MYNYEKASRFHHIFEEFLQILDILIDHFVGKNRFEIMSMKINVSLLLIKQFECYAVFVSLKFWKAIVTFMYKWSVYRLLKYNLIQKGVKQQF